MFPSLCMQYASIISSNNWKVNRSYFGSSLNCGIPSDKAASHQISESIRARSHRIQMQLNDFPPRMPWTHHQIFPYSSQHQQSIKQKRIYYGKKAHGFTWRYCWAAAVPELKTSRGCKNWEKGKRIQPIPADCNDVWCLIIDKLHRSQLHPHSYIFCMSVIFLSFACMKEKNHRATHYPGYILEACQSLMCHSDLRMSSPLHALVTFRANGRYRTRGRRLATLTGLENLMPST